MADTRSGVSVEWIVGCLCSLTLSGPGFFFASCDRGTLGGSPSITSKQLILRSPKITHKNVLIIPTSLYNLIDTMT